MIAMTTRSGQTIRVAENRVEHWEARGYVRADQPTAEEKAPAKKAAKKAPTKRAAKKSSSKK